jgi:glycogenin glucosyltransferase
VAKDEYPPELIILQSSKISNDAVRLQLRFFCDRIITVDHIPICSSSNNESKQSHVKQWDENCGWTKLRLFELDSYDTILYIDADCLVVQDVSHLLQVDSSDTIKRFGLLAAAPDIFPPDKFNAGVLVLRPSRSVFDDMISRLPSEVATDNRQCTSYDGGDTGFLNSYYPNWYNDMPSYSRLSFGYNAQRFMHHCTFDKQPKYWDEGIEDIRIIHYSSSPKPWELTSNDATKSNGDASDLLEKNDRAKIQQCTGALERRWHTAFEKSQQYFKKEMMKLQARRANKRQSPAAATATKPKSKAKPSTHQLVQRRYKQLRKEGLSTSHAMQTARDEYGMNQEYDPCQMVGQMFGLS